METNRIILRPWCDSDAEALFKWASDPDVGTRAGWAPHKNVEESLEIIRTVFNDGANRTQSSSLELLRCSPSSHSCNDALHTWAIVLKDTNEPIGAMGYGPSCECDLRCSFPHTTANKATGFLLFIAVPMTFLSIIPFTIVAAIATFAAIHEGHYIRTYHPSFPPLLHGATGWES